MLNFGLMQLDQEKVIQDSEFTATLPNGVTVELVGICEYPSKDKQWLRPDGKRLGMKIVTEDKSRYTSDYPGYEIAFKLEGKDFNFKPFCKLRHSSTTICI